MPRYSLVNMIMSTTTCGSISSGGITDESVGLSLKNFIPAASQVALKVTATLSDSESWSGERKS